MMKFPYYQVSWRKILAFKSFQSNQIVSDKITNKIETIELMKIKIKSRKYEKQNKNLLI